MKTLHYLLALLVAIVVATPSAAQNKPVNPVADNLYNQGVNLYNKQKLPEAIKKFEEVLAIAPNYTDALYNLGMIHIGAGNRENGIAYLQRSARLGDREAANYLRNNLQVKVEHPDTMDIAAVDVVPQIIVNNVPENFYLNGNLHPEVLKQLTTALKNSKIMRSDAGKGKLYAVQIVVSDTGVLDGKLLNHPENIVAQNELSAILRSIGNVTPAVYDGNKVAVTGLVIPIRM